MRNRGQIILGGVILLLGLVWLVGNLAGVDIWGLICPVAIILAGVFLLLRPWVGGEGGQVTVRLLESVDRRGVWRVEGEEIWKFIGDVRLDLTRAEIPEGESRIRIFAFIGDVDVFLPADAGFALAATGFVTDGTILGEKRDHFATTVRRRTENYEAAAKKIFLETYFFVSDLRVEQLD